MLRRITLRQAIALTVLMAARPLLAQAPPGSAPPSGDQKTQFAVEGLRPASDRPRQEHFKRSPSPTNSRSAPRDRRVLIPSQSSQSASPRNRSYTALSPRSKMGTLSSLTTALGALAVVLGLFFLLTWFFKRHMPAAARALPTEAVEVLGRAPLADRQHMHLVRIGQKLLLLSVGSERIETLTEITDPLEVDRLAGLCKQSAATSTSTTFRNTMQRFAQERPTEGFVDPGLPADETHPRRRRPAAETSHA